MGEKKNSLFWERTAELADRGMRLDKFWAGELSGEGVSRGRVKTWIEEGLATVNGAVEDKGKYKLSEGDALAIGAADIGPTEYAAEPVAGDVPVLFEDEDILVVDKPAGVTTHPAPGEPDPTLVNFLLHQYPDMAAERSGMDGQRPGIVHRLDKDTSGIMVVARTEQARLGLAGGFCRTAHAQGLPGRGSRLPGAAGGLH